MSFKLEVPTALEHADLQKQVLALAEDVKFLRLLADPWVSAAKAAEITGRDEKTLRNDRERPGSLLRYRKEGNTVRYSLASLQAYNLRRYTPALETAQRAADALRPMPAA